MAPIRFHQALGKGDVEDGYHHLSVFLWGPDLRCGKPLIRIHNEMLRSHLVDNQLVTRICQHYGISGQTFYNLQARFLNEGTAGLLAKKPGPKGPSKLTPAVRQFVMRQIEHDPQLSPRMLLSQLEQQFDLTFHLRTIEKLLSEYVEGVNRAIRGIINRAFGFRNFKNLRLQILLEHGNT